MIREGNTKADEILAFLKKESKEKHIFPSVREIGEAVGLSSTCTVVYYLKKLEEMGKIKRRNNKSRSMEVLNNDTQALEPAEIYDDENFVSIPMLGQVAAGTPMFAEENYEENYKLPASMFSSGFMFMLKIKGDSMKKIGINEGDKIVVRRQQTAENGEIVVALVDDSATVKRFFRESNKIKLQPENDAYTPMYFDDVQILGKVVGLIRNY